MCEIDFNWSITEEAKLHVQPIYQFHYMAVNGNFVNFACEHWVYLQSQNDVKWCEIFVLGL